MPLEGNPISNVFAGICLIALALTCSSFYKTIASIQPLVDGMVTIEAPITLKMELLTLMGCNADGGVILPGFPIPCNTGNATVYAEYEGATIMLDGHKCGIQEYLTWQGTEYRPTDCPQGVTPGKTYSLTGNFHRISDTYGYMLVESFDEL